MSLLENKAGAAAVDPADFNTVIDAVVSLETDALPTGWTQDTASPANVDSNNGNLDLSSGSLVANSAQVATVTVGAISDPPKILAGTADPTAGGGAAANVGSLYLRTTGTVWAKTGAGNTAWTQLAPVA